MSVPLCAHSNPRITRRPGCFRLLVATTARYGNAHCARARTRSPPTPHRVPPGTRAAWHRVSGGVWKVRQARTLPGRKARPHGRWPRCGPPRCICGGGHLRVARAEWTAWREFFEETGSMLTDAQRDSFMGRDVSAVRLPWGVCTHLAATGSARVGPAHGCQAASLCCTRLIWARARQTGPTYPGATRPAWAPLRTQRCCRCTGSGCATSSTTLPTSFPWTTTRRSDTCPAWPQPRRTSRPRACQPPALSPAVLLRPAGPVKSSAAAPRWTSWLQPRRDYPCLLTARTEPRRCA